MSKTARTPYKTKKERTKGRASSKKQCVRRGGAMDSSAPNRQFCLQSSLECRQRW